MGHQEASLGDTRALVFSSDLSQESLYSIVCRKPSGGDFSGGEEVKAGGRKSRKGSRHVSGHKAEDSWGCLGAGVQAVEAGSSGPWEDVELAGFSRAPVMEGFWLCSTITSSGVEHSGGCSCDPGEQWRSLAPGISRLERTGTHTPILNTVCVAGARRRRNSGF